MKIEKPPAWTAWANEAERDTLFWIRQEELRFIHDRKKIRDRCYQRARRAKR